MTKINKKIYKIRLFKVVIDISIVIAYIIMTF